MSGLSDARPGRLPADLTSTFSTLGRSFAIRSDIEGTSRTADELFASWRSSPSTCEMVYELRAHGDGGLSELLANGRSIQRGNGPGSMLSWIIADVGRMALAQTQTHVTVHAGVVARDGVAVMLPAPPDHGKTTTVIGLVRAGFDFLSDESAAIRLEDGRVHPFARPLMLAPDSMALFPDLRASLPEWVERFRNLNFLIPPQVLRPGCLGGPCEVRFVAAPTYEAGSTTALEKVSRAEMLTLLLSQTFNLELVGARGVERLATLLGGAECYRLRIGSLDDAVQLIDGLVAG